MRDCNNIIHPVGVPVSSLQQSEYRQRHFTGFRCCLCHSHVPYTDRQINHWILYFKTLTRKREAKTKKSFCSGIINLLFNGFTYNNLLYTSLDILLIAHIFLCPLAYLYTCQPPEYKNLETSRNRSYTTSQEPLRGAAARLDFRLQWGAVATLSSNTVLVTYNQLDCSFYVFWSRAA